MWATTRGWLAAFWGSWLPIMSYLIGGFDVLVEVLLLLMALDYLTGLAVGFKQKTLNSQRGYKGLRKKVMIMAILCAAAQFNRIVPGIDFRSMVGMFYSTMEILSITENLGKLGLDIPPKLKRALEQLQENNKSKK